MKLPFFKQMPAFKTADIHQTIERALSSAGLQTRSGPMLEVTDTIRRALASAGLGTDPTPHPQDAAVIDVVARVVDTPADAARDAARPPQALRPGQTEQTEQTGQFVTCMFSAAAGSRAYKLYVPDHAPALPMPLIVMLHGCTQSADDFAAGTQMNRLAEEQGFIVVYPEQPSSANLSKCWNWFSTQDQTRDGGEPALIAGITREVMASQPVDPRRVFVAGLSAGAAMAVVMGETYPELYAGVGAHSGLPYGSAHDIPSAMAAMKGSRRPGHRPDMPHLAGGAAAARSRIKHAVPTIVFHGDRDHTVKQSNSQTIVEQACQARVADADKGARSGLSKTVEQGTSAAGRAFSRTVHTDAAGHAAIESWVLHGAGHAWSGGDASGSYTDQAGPDASAEMVRFFLAQPPADSV